MSGVKRTYASDADRNYNCVITYLTPAGKRTVARAKAIASTATDALDIAEKLIRKLPQRRIHRIIDKVAYCLGPR